MSASEDAALLRTAMKGWGTNEDSMIKVCVDKTNEQLVAIRDAYTAEIERDLIKDIKSETRGDFEDLLVGIFTPEASYDAGLIMSACKGLGTNEDLLTEVLGTRSPAQIASMNDAFTALFDKDMLSMVEDETSGEYQKSLNLLITGERSEDQEDEDLDKDVKALFDAGENKWGTNEGVFIRTICGHSRKYCESLYYAYAKAHDVALDTVILDEMGGDAAKILAVLVTPLEIYFAEKLFKAMDGVGTDDTSLIRIVVSQKDHNLHEINNRFLNDRKKTLKSWMKDECSGDYENLLVGIVMARE